MTSSDLLPFLVLIVALCIVVPLLWGFLADTFGGEDEL